VLNGYVNYATTCIVNRLRMEQRQSRRQSRAIGQVDDVGGRWIAVDPAFRAILRDAVRIVTRMRSGDRSVFLAAPAASRTMTRATRSTLIRWYGLHRSEYADLG
jgi:hypothetical protein